MEARDLAGEQVGALLGGVFDAEAAHGIGVFPSLLQRLEKAGWQRALRLPVRPRGAGWSCSLRASGRR